MMVVPSLFVEIFNSTFIISFNTHNNPESSILLALVVNNKVDLLVPKLSIELHMQWGLQGWEKFALWTRSLSVIWENQRE